VGAGPYQRACWTYRQAGWIGVIPLPAGQKGPPPRGYTGWAGVDPSGPDVQTWADGPEGAGNIGLRIPVGVYGLDVDDYGGKMGGAALGQLVAAWGPLPPTWTVSSREDSASGIRLYRAVPAVGQRWRDEPGGHGAGIEAIHFGHRYAVVAPSMHPETGRKYVWRRPDGMPAGEGEVPRPSDLPELPAAWVTGLAEAGEARTGDMAGHAETLERVHGWRTGEDACARVREARERGIVGLAHAADGAALHPTARDAVHELVNLGHEGHVGPRVALAEHYSRFVEIRAGRDGADRRAAEAEWWRLVRGAIGKLRPDTGHAVCDCELWTGAGLAFDDVEREAKAVTPDALPAADATGAVEAVPVVDPVEVMRAQLLTPAQIAARPAPIPLVGGLLYLDTLAWLIGKSGSFKSFLALDVAAHVAAGTPWAGRRTVPGDVLYLVAEGVGGMGLRVRAWAEQHGVPMCERVLMLPKPVQARGDEWGVLVALVRSIRPVLIVIDTQARVTVGINENDNTDMGMFVEQVDRLKRASGACVLIVHHIGRQGEDARGASALDGAQDTELKAERVGGRTSMRARLVVDKQKDGPDTESVEFVMVPVELGRSPDGEALSSLAVSASAFLEPFPIAPWREGLTENQGMIVDILRELFSERGGTKAEVAGALRERGQRGGPKFIKTSFHYAWNSLLKKDKLHRIKGSQRFVWVDEHDQ
jgi:hypothetical protein